MDDIAVFPVWFERYVATMVAAIALCEALADADDAPIALRARAVELMDGLDGLVRQWRASRS